MRTKKHYDDLLNNNPVANVGFALAADAVYAARHDNIIRAEAHGGDEWKNIARMLKKKYGKELTIDQVRHEMEPAQTAAATLGRKGGQSRSEAKIKAVRENGKLGGRPRKKKPV